MYYSYPLVVATDLDGTFLEGDDQEKKYFYNELVRLQQEVLLIYTTGRPVDAVEQFCREGYLPHPHYVIGDLGSHIVEGLKFSPLEPLQTPIIEMWNNSSAYLKDLLKHESSVQLQPIDPPYRVAYYYDPDRLQAETVQKILSEGFDVIQSCDMYLDILPKGVNKGSSLLKVIQHLNINPEAVITFGDSLNDLALFQTGLKSVAVSNSEPKLVSEIKKMNNVYLSKFPGILGIIDGIRFFNKFQLFQEP